MTLQERHPFVRRHTGTIWTIPSCYKNHEAHQVIKTQQASWVFRSYSTVPADLPG